MYGSRGRRQDLGGPVDNVTVIVHGGVLYYSLSYGGYTPKSQLAAIKPLFLSVTMIYLLLSDSPFTIVRMHSFETEAAQWREERR
jgi:hypothetical protein